MNEIERAIDGLLDEQVDVSDMSRVEIFQTILSSQEARDKVMRELYDNEDRGAGLSLATDDQVRKAVVLLQQRGEL